MKLKIEESNTAVNVYIAKDLDGTVVYTIKRGHNFKWVAFNQKNVKVDQDQYRYDLFERLELI